MSRETLLSGLLFVFLCLLFGYSTAINYNQPPYESQTLYQNQPPYPNQRLYVNQSPYAPVPLYHDYNTRIISNYNQRLDQTRPDRPARKPHEYTQFYLNAQRENAYNNLYNYVANYRAYLHRLYQSPKFGTIKGYNYVRRRSNDLDSLENNQTLPDVYSLNFDQPNSNCFLILPQFLPLWRSLDNP